MSLPVAVALPVQSPPYLRDHPLPVGQHPLERDQRRVPDVGVRAENVGAFELQDPLQLVAEARTGVVRVGLEGHPEDADRRSLDLETLL